MAETLFHFLIYPGLLFAGLVGGLLAWFDRKITAQVQFRKGPPVLQPFYDFFKLLLVKETLLPARGARITFLLAPVFGLFGATTAGVFILLPLFNINIGFEGDVMVIFYLLTIPSLTYIIGALASGNPLASVGASREIKLIISYELTFLLFFAAIILKADQTMRMSEIIQMQAQTQPFIGSLSGILLFIVGVFCVQAKLGMVPFDIAEAETELSEGSFIEYSGTVYALVKLTKYIMLFILPALIAGFLMSGFHLEGLGILWAILKILAVVLLLTLIRNTNPRLKVGQAMRFFLIGMNVLVILAIVLIYLGL
jgi:NADH-quinone oxidoreductase subunit H